MHKSEQVRTSTERLRLILDAKYKKAHLHNVMKNKCQQLAET